jgi:hypothetical protein
MLVELSYFYKHICSNQVSKAMMEKLEKEISMLVCKMEKIFPSGWLNVMRYFVVHLP